MDRDMETLKELDSEITSLRHQLARSGLDLDKSERKGKKDPTSSVSSDVPGSVVSFHSSSVESSQPGNIMNRIQEMVPHLVSQWASEGTGFQLDWEAGGEWSGSERLETSETLLDMSRTRESAQVMRESGCVRHLLRLLHPPDLLAPPTQEDIEVMMRAAEALLNMVEQEGDERRRRREVKVVKLLGQVRAHTLHSRLLHAGLFQPRDLAAQDILPVLALLMQLSFTPDHRIAMAQLGGLEALAELLICDELLGSSSSECNSSNEVRRFVGMSLTNLTFGDEASKALLTSFPHFLRCVVAQVKRPNEELRSVYGSVVRNLSWKAEEESKRRLEESGAVGVLMGAAMEAEKEATLKAVLSALWNLSAHSTANKRDICATPAALPFLVRTLGPASAARTTAVVENGGGILRNVSSQIAVSEEMRQELRDHSAFRVLLAHLESPSLTIVSNACGTLWNLSARCPEDQRTLWKLGTVPMLQGLMHSKHKNIAQGATAALRNLLSNPPVSAPSLDLADTPYLASSHHSNALRSMEASTESERSFASRYNLTPSKHILHVMGKMVRPVEHLQSPAVHRGAVSCSPEPPSAAANRRASREEAMSADKAAVLRYHTSLKKRYHHYAAHQGGQPQMLTGSQHQVASEQEDEHPKAFTVEATPGQSQSGSASDLSKLGRPSRTVDGDELLIESPLMGSRHSSCESLHQDEQNSSDFLSNVPSIYSTRNPTGHVTPSDLPDSPSHSMPTSPPPSSARLDKSSPLSPSDAKDCLSPSSSFSAITIDDETRIKSCRAPIPVAEEDPEYAMFAGKDGANTLLEKSLISAYPTPMKPSKKSAMKERRKSSKTELRRPSKSSSLDVDTPKTFQDEGGAPRRVTKTEPSPPKPRTEETDSGNTSRGEPQVSANILAAIDSVLPKPRSAQTTPPKPIAVTKPMMRQEVARVLPTEEPEDCEMAEEEATKVFAVEGTPATQSRAQSRPHSPPAAPAAQWSPKKWAGAGVGGSGILETSGCSGLAGSVEPGWGPQAFLMGTSIGHSSTLEDVQPPEELMAISGCSLMRNSATSEKVKDASNLLLKDSLVRQATQTAAAAVAKESSETSGSLSEDNYSRLDESETFDISPEDVDLSLVEEDAKDVVLQLESGPLQDELLIDCETLSLVSNDSHNLSQTASPARKLTPRIAKEPPPPQPLPVKGGRKKTTGLPSNWTQTSGPVVRTTKTALLRAKNNAGGSNRTSPSQSAQSLRTPPRSPVTVAGQGRRGRESPSNPEPPKDRPLVKKRPSNSLSSNDSRGRKSCNPQRPPVPPKPRSLARLGVNNNPAPKTRSPKEEPVKGSSKRMLVTTV